MRLPRLLFWLHGASFGVAVESENWIAAVLFALAALFHSGWSPNLRLRRRVEVLWGDGSRTAGDFGPGERWTLRQAMNRQELPRHLRPIVVTVRPKGEG